MYDVVDVISDADSETACVGYIVKLSNNLLVKWNKNSCDFDNIKNEVYYQNLVHNIGLAAKIHAYYEIDNHVYIFMENLCDKGYKTVGYFLENENEDIDDDKMMNSIKRSIDELHNNGFIHGDIHEYNMFYNPDKDHVLFIDFDKSKKSDDPKKDESYQFFYDINFL